MADRDRPVDRPRGKLSGLMQSTAQEHLARRRENGLASPPSNRREQRSVGLSEWRSG